MWFPPGCPVNGLSLPTVVGFTQWATHGARHLKANRSGDLLGVRRSQSFITNAELTHPGFGGPRVSPLTPNSPVSMQPDIADAESTYSESESVKSDMRAEVESDESEADDGRMDNNFRFSGYHGYHH